MEFSKYIHTPSSQKILSSARKVTRQQNYFTYLLGLFLIPSLVRPFFYSWYAYFRWVDDTADSQGLTLEGKKDFLSYQIKLTKDLYQHSSRWHYDKNSPEAFLAALVSFDQQRGAPLQKPILDLLSCIYYDVTRIATYPDQQQLSEYIELEVTSYLKTFLSFCCPEANLEDFPRPYEGIAGKWVHILRDFIPDLRHHIINMSQEERAAFQITLASQQSESPSENLRNWAAAKALACDTLFTRGKQNLLHHQSLRYKIGIAILCAKYEYYLSLLKKNNYLLQENYPFHPDQFCLNLVQLLWFLGIILLSHLRPRQRHSPLSLHDT